MIFSVPHTHTDHVAGLSTVILFTLQLSKCIFQSCLKYRITEHPLRAHTCFVDARISNNSMKHMSPALNGS